MYHFRDAEPAQIGVFPNPRKDVPTQTVRYECTKCDSYFTTRAFLHQHESVAHTLILHCPFCPTLFSNKADLRIHIIAHKEKRLLRCAFCKNIFADVDKYTSHMKSHTEPVLHKCNECPALFCQLSQLRTHSATHVKRKYIHTIPIPNKDCLCRIGSRDAAENNGINPTVSIASVTAACQTEAASSGLSCEPQDFQPDCSKPEAICSRSYKSKENLPEKSSSSSCRKRKTKVNKEERCLKKMKAGTTTETEANVLSENHLEPNSASVEPISSVLQEVLTTLEENRDDGVNSAAEEQPVSTLTDRNVVNQTGRSPPQALEQTSETNSSQPMNENRENILAVDKSIPIPEPFEVIDLTSNSDEEKIYSNRSSADRLGKLQKSKSPLKSGRFHQKSSAPRVCMIKKVSVSFNTTPSAAPVSRVTIIRPVTLSKTSTEPENANKTSSTRQTCIANSREGMQRKSRPVYELNLSGEITKSTTAKSSTFENAESVYTFAEEEDLNRNAATSNSDSSPKKKRRRSEQWRFFVSTPKPRKKTAKLSERKSVHFYQCSRCIRMFANNNLLSKHELVHSQNKGISCDICGGVFRGLGNLTHHKKLTHNQPVEE